MEKYIIKFYQDYDSLENGAILNVDETEMWNWITRAKKDNLKLEVYKAILLVDLS